MYERLIDSPVGLLTLRAEDGALTAILFGDQRTGLPGSNQILDQAEAELKEYFAGERKEFPPDGDRVSEKSVGRSCGDPLWRDGHILRDR